MGAWDCGGTVVRQGKWSFLLVLQRLWLCERLLFCWSGQIKQRSRSIHKKPQKPCFQDPRPSNIKIMVRSRPLLGREKPCRSLADVLPRLASLRHRHQESDAFGPGDVCGRMGEGQRRFSQRVSHARSKMIVYSLT